VVPRAPHGLQIEHAQEFNEAVLQFLGASTSAVG
jgi:hypothetical protein